MQKPVSYTHLDVYKRQTLDSVSAGVATGTTGAAFTDADRMAAEMCIRDSNNPTLDRGRVMPAAEPTAPLTRFDETHH